MVNNHIVEQQGLFDFAACLPQPFFNHFRAIGVAAAQAFGQYGKTRRQDKNADGLRQRTAHLFRTLHVDFQDNVETFALQCLQTAEAGTVIIAEHVGIFEEFAFTYHALEFSRTDEIIMFAVPLAFARGTGGMGNGNADIGVSRQQPGNQCGFTRAGSG